MAFFDQLPIAFGHVRIVAISVMRLLDVLILTMPLSILSFSAIAVFCSVIEPLAMIVSWLSTTSSGSKYLSMIATFWVLAGLLHG
jgi:uncharacterized membrane protein